MNEKLAAPSPASSPRKDVQLDPTKCYCAECYQPLGSGPCTKVEPEGKGLGNDAGSLV
jgi:hypothetical protein